MYIQGTALRSDSNMQSVLRRLIATLSSEGELTEEAAAGLLEHLKTGGPYMLGSPRPVFDPLKTIQEMDEQLQKLESKIEPKVYSSCSGMDTQVFILKDGGLVRPSWIQGVSFNHDVTFTQTQPIMGSIIALTLDGSVFNVGDKFDMVLQAINELGHAWWIGAEGVEIIGHGTGVSIDDITIDDNFTFCAKVFHPWTKGRIVFSDGALLMKGNDGAPISRISQWRG